MNRGKNLLLIISPVVVTFLIYGFILFFLFQQGYSPSLFIRAGSQYVDTSVPVDLIPNNIGYDGQFYYGLSIDPVFNNNPSHGITLDYPHYRQQRIIYPVLVHLLSFGNSNLIPGMLIVVNFLSICILAALGGLFAQQNGKSPWYGLLFSLYPGFFVTFTRDLVEIVAGVFLLATVLAIYKKTT